MGSIFSIILLITIVSLTIHVVKTKYKTPHIDVDVDTSNDFISFKSDKFKICIEKKTKELNYKFTYIHTDGGVISLEDFINNNQKLIINSHDKKLVSVLIIFIKQYIKE